MRGERVGGKYELRRLLGEGATGAVYEGVHVDIGKRVAVKLIQPEFCESPEIEARFRREARAVSAVESEYIAQIFDFGRDERLGLYMVIEYLEGEDLEARIARERWLSDRETAGIGVQIGRGLARAHAAGIVHRDLKPANIFLTRGDDGGLHARILDFGISRFERERGPASTIEPTLTSYGTTVGTPQYMAPEQCAGSEVDARADVWALCAVLYEMIAGEPAVGAQGGHVQTMERILQQDVPPLAGRASWASPTLAEVIDAGLAREPARRIPDASTLVARLLEACPEAGARASAGAIEHATDVSELAPTEGDHDRASQTDLHVAPPDALPAALFGDATVAPTLAPPSVGPASGAEDGVAIFAREEQPRELVDLRRRSQA